MTSTDFIAAWKDPAVRAHLSEHELSILPVNPAGRSPLDALAGPGVVHATYECLGKPPCRSTSEMQTGTPV
jgi:mersacidin/lichenicidin family type 2 lantibiotic